VAITGGQSGACSRDSALQPTVRLNNAETSGGSIRLEPHIVLPEAHAHDPLMTQHHSGLRDRFARKNVDTVVTAPVPLSVLAASVWPMYEEA
jgi:hypothetical protein